MNEEKIKISINEEDVQNIIDCYEKDIKYIEALEKENKQLKEQLEREIKVRDEIHNYLHNKINEQKHILDELEKWLEEEKLRNTPKARWKHYNEDGFHDYDIENGDYIEMQPVNITLTEVINKLKELRGRE